MGKYSPLETFLTGSVADAVSMTFAEIEGVLGAPLPPSKRSPAWWSNNPANNVMTRAWRAAGFRAEQVDVGGERVVFRRDAACAPDADTPLAYRDPEGFLARGQARMTGMVTFPPDLDLTAPTGEVWDAEIA